MSTLAIVAIICGTLAGVSIAGNGVQLGAARHSADTLEAATANTEAALAPVLAEQQRQADQMATVLDSERLEPFCDSADKSRYDLLMCAYFTCSQEQAAQGQVASEACGDLRKRILARDEWALCSVLPDKDARNQCFQLL